MDCSKASSKPATRMVDDRARANKEIDELVTHVTKLLDFFMYFKLNLHPAKWRLYRNVITWCGRHISTDRVRFDPRHKLGLENMEYPTVARAFLQFTSAVQWLRTSIPKFSTTIQPLLHALERAFKKAGKITRRPVTAFR